MSERDKTRTADGAARGGSARYGPRHGPGGSGHQESKKLEKKDERGFVPRQGGDQSRHGQARADLRRG